MIGVSNANSDKVYVLEENNGRFGGLYSSDNAANSLQKLITGIIIILDIPQSADDDRGQSTQRHGYNYKP